MFGAFPLFVELSTLASSLSFEMRSSVFCLSFECPVSCMISYLRTSHIVVLISTNLILYFLSMHSIIVSQIWFYVFNGIYFSIKLSSEICWSLSVSWLLLISFIDFCSSFLFALSSTYGTFSTFSLCISAKALSNKFPYLSDLLCEAIISPSALDKRGARLDNVSVCIEIWACNDFVDSAFMALVSLI